jgi:O-antigen biosynthesis protein
MLYKRPLGFIYQKIKYSFPILVKFLRHQNYIKGFNILRRHGLFSGLMLIKSKFNSDYQKWIERYDTYNKYDQALAKKQIKEFKSQPLFSIVMPTYNSNIAWLNAAIESVQNQIYQNWELCIADDASENKNIKAALKGWAVRDKRIKIVFRKNNGHISEASKSALELATGDWVGFLDHDDILAPHALFLFAKATNLHPGLKIIYSDEDKLDKKNKRSGPYFKPDWNEDLFLSHNLLSHFTVYRRNLIKKVGGLRTEFNGSQDYDLALRCIEVIKSEEIFHIPHILYHWRIHNLSTAKSHKSKPYAILAGEKALNEHFLRIKIKAKAKIEPKSKAYRVRYALPRELPLVSLIILTRNQFKVFKKCIESILSKTTYSNYEIIIVDNGSDDPEILRYMKSLSKRKNISVIRDASDFNFSALNNLGVSVSRGSLIGWINNDIEVISPDWLSEMVSHAIRKGVGAVGAKLYYSNNTIQHAGVILGVGGYAAHSHRFFPRSSNGYAGRLNLTQSYSAVTGACLVVKKSIYQKVGGLDEEKFKVAFNDIDFCLKVLSYGYKNIWTPYAEMYHYESLSRGYDDTPEKKLRYKSEQFYLQEKWNALIKYDPAYNPNLTLSQENFSLSFPSRIGKLDV